MINSGAEVVPGNTLTGGDACDCAHRPKFFQDGTNLFAGHLELRAIDVARSCITLEQYSHLGSLPRVQMRKQLENLRTSGDREGVTVRRAKDLIPVAAHAQDRRLQFEPRLVGQRFVRLQRRDGAIPETRRPVQPGDLERFVYPGLVDGLLKHGDRARENVLNHPVLPGQVLRIKIEIHSAIWTPAALRGAADRALREISLDGRRRAKKRQAQADCQSLKTLADMPEIRRPVEEVAGPSLQREVGFTEPFESETVLGDALRADESIRPEPNLFSSGNDELENIRVATMHAERGGLIVTEKQRGFRASSGNPGAFSELPLKLQESQPELRVMRLHVLDDERKSTPLELAPDASRIPVHGSIAAFRQ